MVLGIAEDFTSNVVLDSELTNIPASGMYINSGVNASITVENLLSFLPVLNRTIPIWDSESEYGIFSDTRNIRDIVSYNGNLYQSVHDNIGIIPTLSGQTVWMETNIESLRIKSFLSNVKDRFLSDMGLTERLINSQLLYEDACLDRPMVNLPVNYAGWVFEAKGSDYVTIKINAISIQKDGVESVPLYVIHNKELVAELSITPSNGAVSFTPQNFPFSGSGEWRFVIDSTTVYTDNAWIDPLKYDGFVCYGCVGIGDAPETATYSISNSAYGLGFNISVYLNPALYIENNINQFGKAIRSTFEYMMFQMFKANPNNRKNAVERIQMSEQELLMELKDMTVDTVLKRYVDNKKDAIKQLNKTYDTQLTQPTGLEISVGSI